jgi:exopolysaccharide production repressor protein
MYGPRVFVSMIGALLVFAIVTYAMNGSFWTTVFQTVLCAVLLQVGYFVGVLFMVWKAARDGREADIDAPGQNAEADAPSSALSASHFNKPGSTNY